MTSQTIDTAPTQQALGESEHDKAMIAVAEGQTPETPQENPETPSESDSRPEWLPEKFKSAEDMAKAYSELEKKLGAPKEQPQETQETQEQPEESKGSEGSLDFDGYAKEVLESGELSEASIKQLTDIGLPQEVINQYVDSFKAQAQAQQAQSSEQVNSIYEVTGGEDGYKQVTEWASENVDRGLVEAYNKSIQSNDAESAKSILSVINQQYQAAMGSEGKRLSATPSATAGDNYTDWAQVQKDMNDPRYSGVSRDASFVKQVEEKLARSNI